MQKYLFFLLLIPSVIFAEDSSIFDNHTWYLDNNTLRTQQHEPFPLNGKYYDHSISYTTPSGMHGNSDACALSSPTSLSCLSGDTITYNADAYSATLTTTFSGSYKYYEKDHVPQGSPFSGSWHRESSSAFNCRDGSVINIVVPYHDKNARRLSNIDIYYNGGFSHFNTYFLVKDNYSGQLAFSPTADKVYYTSFYLFDVNNNPIYDFDKIDTLVKLNDAGGKFNPECNMIR